MFNRRSITGLGVFASIAGAGVVMMATSVFEAEGLSTVSQSGPFPSLSESWRTDELWYDGKAEYAIYAAQRVIYGRPRTYDAVMITNKQRMDPETTTKAADWQQPGTFEVFKHNVREVIPTPNYDYKFLTTSFIRTDDLSPYKVVMSSQEDCGTTYKQIEMSSGTVAGHQFVYFPDAGHIEANYDLPPGLQAADGLPVSLRDYPFGDASHPSLSMRVIPDQTSTRTTVMEAVQARVTFEGTERLDLPIGEVEAYHLKVAMARGQGEAHYWFASDRRPEWLRVMVRYQGPNGQVYELKDHRRWDYWIFSP